MPTKRKRYAPGRYQFKRGYGLRRMGRPYSDKRKRWLAKLPKSSIRKRIVDRDGRHIGHMWPEDFEAFGKSLWGSSWRRDFARYAGVTLRRVDAWASGAAHVPRYAALLMWLAYHYVKETPGARKPLDIPTPWLEDDWVPEGEEVVLKVFADDDG